jgi:hypothetical protein
MDSMMINNNTNKNVYLSSNGNKDSFSNSILFGTGGGGVTTTQVNIAIIVALSVRI